MSTRSSDEVISTALRRAGARAQVLIRHQLMFDSATALTLGLVSLVGLIVQGRLHHLDTIVFCVALVLPMPLRSRDQRAAFACVAVVALAQWWISTPQIADASVLILLFWIAIDGDLIDLAASAAVVEVGAILAALRWSPSDPLKVWVGITGLGVAFGAVGLALRERRQLVASLEERATRLELERDQEGRLGALAERARIAREMHDIVSHNLTVMITLADGAQYALQDSPESASAAMARLSGTGRQALSEMRRLLGVLHEDGPADPYEPQPGLDRLDELLERVEAAGVPVSIQVEGDPHRLTTGVQLTVFRVAQEALTNTLKHASRPTSARLSLSCQPHQITLDITDSGGSQAPQGIEIPSGGQGLRGMQERAAAFGGELQAGPMPGGGWRVVLTLPVEIGSVAR